MTKLKIERMEDWNGMMEYCVNKTKLSDREAEGKK